MERDQRGREHLNKISCLNRMGEFMARDILSILGPDHQEEFGPLLQEILVQRKKEQTVEQQQLKSKNQNRMQLGDYELHAFRLMDLL
jgi:hypothetical protein